MGSIMKNSKSTKTSKKKHSLVLTSCLFPPDLLRQRVAFSMMDEIVKELKKNNDHQTINTLLFAGDIIYADASAGILDPSDPKEKFDGAYKRLEATKSWKNLTAKLHHRFHTIDDHEIVDNWERSVNPDNCKLEGCDEKLMAEGKKRFQQFSQSNSGNEATNVDEKSLWGSRQADGLHLFLLDTRTERDARSAYNSRNVKMISGVQRKALLNWLDELHAVDLKNPEDPPVPKFIMSGSMILPRRVDAAYAAELNAPTLQSDSWDGYPKTRERILRHIAEKDIRNIVFLSGDEHLPVEATTVLKTADDRKTTVYSLHGSPLWAPFEFANTHQSAMMESDTYVFTRDGSSPVEANVQAEFPDVGNGFLHISMSVESPTQLELEYVGDRGRHLKTLKLCTNSL